MNSMKINREEIFSEKITLIQYICSIIIVILHSNNLNGYNFINNGERGIKFVYNLERFISIAGHLAVPTFFVISAYLFFRNFQISKYFAVIKRKIKTLFIPYLIWNTIGFIFFAILTHSSFINKSINKEPLSLIPIDIVISIINSENTPLWYVKYLMIFFVISPIIYIILKNKIIGFVAILIMILNYYIHAYTYYSFLTWIPIFMIGAYLGINFPKYIFNNSKNNAKSIRKKKIVDLFIFIIFVILWIISFKSNEDRRVLYTLRLISPFFMWNIFDYIKWTSPLKWWVRISFFLYCTHFYVVSIFQKIMLIIFGNGTLWTLVVYLVTPVVTIYFITVVANYIIKYTPKVWNIINGGR